MGREEGVATDAVELSAAEQHDGLLTDKNHNNPNNPNKPDRMRGGGNPDNPNNHSSVFAIKFSSIEKPPQLQEKSKTQFCTRCDYDLRSMDKFCGSCAFPCNQAAPTHNHPGTYAAGYDEKLPPYSVV